MGELRSIRSIGIDIVEEPIPITNTKTAETFEKALIKAGLLYDKIFRSEQFQYAIVSSKSWDLKEGEFAVVYISSLDNKAYTKVLNYANIWRAGYGSGGCEKEQYHMNKNIGEELLMVGNMDPGKAAYYKYGIIRYNGRLILPAIYDDIDNIGGRFIHVHLNKNHVLFDYEGNVILKTSGTTSYNPSSMEINGERVIHIFNTNDETLTIYVVVGETVYKILTEDYKGYNRDGRAMSIRAGIFLKKNTGSKLIDRSRLINRSEVMELMKKEGPLPKIKSKAWEF